MTVPPVVPVIAISIASLLTGLVLAFVLRARRLNAADLCALCAKLLPLEGRYRFHGRTVCPRCAPRLRFLAIPRLGRFAVLLALWTAGAAALIAMVAQHDRVVRVWAPLFGGLVVMSLLVGALPAPTENQERTAATLRRLHALLRGHPGERSSRDR